VRVVVPGRILDERYTQLLMQQPRLSLAQVMLLDRVQKRRTITREQHKDLEAAKLVEGRFPNLIVGSAIAKATGETAHHIDQRGFDKKWYVDLILELVREHGPVGRKEVDELLVPKLPGRLTDLQKSRKVHKLLQELRRAGRIRNEGTRQESKWVLPNQPEGDGDR
jgi:ATP-dependent DNA helicase RecG